MADNGFDLSIKPYCAFCPHFKPDVEKIDITVISDKIPRTLTAIRCEHRVLCEQINERMTEVANG